CCPRRATMRPEGKPLVLLVASCALFGALSSSCSEANSSSGDDGTSSSDALRCRKPSQPGCGSTASSASASSSGAGGSTSSTAASVTSSGTSVSASSGSGGSSSGAGGGFPDATNTGVPAGTVLTTSVPPGVIVDSDGLWKVNTAGAVID